VDVDTEEFADKEEKDAWDMVVTVRATVLTAATA
jgi:hypothetical protein